MSEIIAVVGMTGSGKSEVSDFLEERGYQFIRFGQITLDEIQRRGLEPTEENEVKIREGFRKELGMAAFAILNQPKLDELLQKGDVVIDGLYSWAEYRFLKEKYREKLKVLSVNTPREIRYNRLERRVTDEKMRGRPATKEQAESRDYAEIENIEKAGPIAMADIIINNSGTKEDLRDQLRNIFEKHSERPKWDEYFLKMAALVAERSTCLRHHIGAIIVKEKRMLTTGYNGAGKGMEDCFELGCVKDQKGIATGEGIEECRAIHAEQNALLQAANYGIPINGATMYCTHSPCRMCAKEMNNAGIKEVVSYQEFSGDKGAKKYLEEAKIIMRNLPRPRSKITFKD